MRNGTPPGKVFYSTKTYEHSVGLSCCFRQWRADSHCSFLHGYALQVVLKFRCDHLDERNWVQDFGGLKQIKQWLQDTFDHKTVVAADDPAFKVFEELHKGKIIDMVVLPAVGCERFAEHIFDHVNEWLVEYGDRYGTLDMLRVGIESVEVREHGGNSAICARSL